MLCKQLVSATQGLQPKLVSSRDALRQPVLIQASPSPIIPFTVCSMSSSPHSGSHVRPVQVAVPSHTALYFHPLQPHSHTQLPWEELPLGEAWPAQEGAEGLSSTQLPSTCSVPGSIVFLQHHDIPAASPKESLQRFSRYTLE